MELIIGIMVVGGFCIITGVITFITTPHTAKEAGYTKIGEEDTITITEISEGKLRTK
jgi:hypothetical protein